MHIDRLEIEAQNTEINGQFHDVSGLVQVSDTQKSMNHEQSLWDEKIGRDC